jgi:hypothetical protein
LRDLDVSSACIGASGVQTVSNSPRFPQLERLRIDGNDIGYEGAAALARAKRFQLKELWVDEQSVGTKGKTLLKKRYGDGMVFS